MRTHRVTLLNGKAVLVYSCDEEQQLQASLLLPLLFDSPTCRRRELVSELSQEDLQLRRYYLNTAHGARDYRIAVLEAYVEERQNE